MSKKITTQTPKGWKYEVGGAISELKKDGVNQGIKRTSYKYKIDRHYYKGRDELMITCPKYGNRGEFNADVYIDNPDGSWTRTKHSIWGKMDENGDIVDFHKYSSDGHCNELNYSLVNNILANNDKYPGPFIRLAKKCQAFFEKNL